MAPLLFVNVQPEQNRSQREQCNSKIRAHVARASYRPRSSRHFQVYRPKPYWERDRSQRREAVFDPWQLSRGLRNDPFEVIPGSNIGVAAVAMDFLTSCLFPAVQIINQAYGSVNHWKQLLAVMSAHGDLFHAVVAVLAAAREIVATDTELRLRQVRPEILDHKCRAISKLRERLSKPNACTDDGAVLTIMFLSIFDQAVGDVLASDVHLRQVDQMIVARGGIAGFTSDEELRDLLVQFRRLSFSKSHLPMRSTRGHRRQVAWSSLMGPKLSRIAPSVTLRGACPSYFSEQEGKLEKPICLAVLKHMRKTSPKVQHLPRSYEDTTLTVTKRLPDVRDPNRRPERATLLWVWLISTDAWRWAGDFEDWRAEVWTSWYTYFA